MGNRLRVAFGLGLGLAIAACGDDSGKSSPSDGSMMLPDGHVAEAGIPDTGVPGMDGGGMDAMTLPPTDGATMNNPDGGGTIGTGSALVGPAGGTVTSSDGRLTIQIPQGVLTRPTQVDIMALGTGPAGAVGLSYQISPSFELFNTQLQRLPVVTLAYADADLMGGNVADLQFGRFDEGGWAELSDVLPNPKTMKIQGTLPRFGTVGLFTGFCEACVPPPIPATACDPTVPTCRANVSDFNPTGQDGKCVAYGAGCGRCVPTCDADNDGYCPGADDYNDNDPHVHAGAPELCNGIDDNCNGHTDEGCTPCTSDAQCTFSQEFCKNGFCNLCDSTTCTDPCSPPGAPTGSNVTGSCHAYGNGCRKCVYTCDMDGDDYCPTANDATGQRGGDCDETSPNAPNVHPGVPEICGNDVDDDCNGAIDDGCAPCSADADCPRNDQYCLGGVCHGCAEVTGPDACTMGSACMIPLGEGMGTAGTCKAFGKACTRCVQTSDFDADGYGANADCDDGDPKVFSTAPEICGDGKDNNCNSHVDEGCYACTTLDQCLSRPHARGQEVCGRETGACDVCPGHPSGGGSSCSASSPCTGNFHDYRLQMQFDMHPDTTGVAPKCVDRGNGCGECVPVCDQDGDGQCPAPTSSDAGVRYDDLPADNQGDCDDTNAAVYKNAPEVCGNMIDDNCNGVVDEDCSVCTTGNMCMAGQTCSSGR